MGETWLIGVVLCTISSFGTGLSKLAIRRSWILEHQQRQQHHGDDDTATTPKHHYKEHVAIDAFWTPPRMRYAALAFMTFGNPLLDIGAFCFCSPSLLAPFSGVSLAWVVLLSRRLIGEQPALQRVIGAVLIMLGEVMIAVFGDHSSHNTITKRMTIGADHTVLEGQQRAASNVAMTVEDVRDSYTDPPFVKYMIFSIALECLFLYIILYSKNSFWKRFAWGVAGGFSTGFQNFIKDAITIVQLTPIHNLIRFWNMPWYFFALVVFAGITAGGGLALLAACMKRYDATYASGTFAGSLTLCASIMSALHYHTFDHLEHRLVNHILYPTGLVILIVGVGLLMHHHTPNDHDKGDGETPTATCTTVSSNNQYKNQHYDECDEEKGTRIELTTSSIIVSSGLRSRTAPSIPRKETT